MLCALTARNGAFSVRRANRPRRHHPVAKIGDDHDIEIFGAITDHLAKLFLDRAVQRRVVKMIDLEQLVHVPRIDIAAFANRRQTRPVQGCGS